MKTIYWVLIIVAIVLVLAYGYNQGWFTSKEAPADVLDANGVSVNPNLKAKVCDPACLVPYPQGSQYYGHYYCNRACSSATFNRPVYQPIYTVTPVVPITPRPIPPGPPRPTPYA